MNQATMTETTLQYLAFAGAQSKDGHKLLMKTLKELANG
ncbi:tail protein [Bacteriophage Phobos]|uniref:Tail protein n=1 Tax=Bacteriophage Phobos TaxID=2662138 RepID=A0A5Q2U746_9CAUD|nr:tail protein [Bacteriophage Phobos]QGH45000.1 tail protein [Bacteriophage Phobos]